MHVISTAIPPDPLETWPDKQDVTDIKNLIRLTPDQINQEGISFVIDHDT
jgi:hypothetical protein